MVGKFVNPGKEGVEIFKEVTDDNRLDVLGKESETELMEVARFVLVGNFGKLVPEIEPKFVLGNIDVVREGIEMEVTDKLLPLVLVDKLERLDKDGRDRLVSLVFNDTLDKLVKLREGRVVVRRKLLTLLVGVDSVKEGSDVVKRKLVTLNVGVDNFSDVARLLIDCVVLEETDGRPVGEVNLVFNVVVNFKLLVGTVPGTTCSIVVPLGPTSVKIVKTDPLVIVVNTTD